MKFKKLIPLILITIAVVAGYANSLPAADKVEWSILNTLQLEEAAIDVAISPDGRRIFVLTKQGEVVVYTSGIKESIKFNVGKQVDQIKVGPAGDTLVLNSRQTRSLQVIALDFVQNINISGSPFKGREDAPVVVAVFSDFE